MRRCPACGTGNPSDEILCRECGAKIAHIPVEPSLVETIRSDLRRLIGTISRKIEPATAKISIKVNQLMLNTQRRIDRFKLTRKYNRMRREEAKRTREIQEDHEVVQMREEIDRMENGPSEEVSSETLKSQLDDLDAEKTSEGYSSKLRRNPFRYYAILQVLITMGILGGAIFGGWQFVGIQDPNDILLLGLMILGGIIIGFFIWRYMFTHFYNGFMHLIIKNWLFRKFIAGGSFSFYEHKDALKEPMLRKITEPIGMTISTLITTLGLAATLVGIFRATGIITEADLNSFVLWGVLALLVPILATPILPIMWALDDARIKSYDKRTGANWLVSKRYKRRFNSFVSVTAVVSNLYTGGSLQEVIAGATAELETFGAILQTGAIIMLITVALLQTIYYFGYRGYLRKKTLEALDLPTYEIQIELLNVRQFESLPVEDEEGNGETPAKAVDPLEGAVEKPGVEDAEVDEVLDKITKEIDAELEVDEPAP